MARPGNLLPGRLAVEQGWLTASQLEEALHACADEPGGSLAVHLVSARSLAHAQVSDLFAAHAERFAQADPHAAERLQSWRYAARAIEQRLVPIERVDLALREQARRDSAGEPWTPLADLLARQGALTVVDAPEPDPARVSTDRPGAVAATQAGGPAPTEHPTPAVAGQRFGKYELLRELGRGGMGVVYQAWHPGLRAHFAVKVMPAGPQASADEAARFHREAQALARLDHPGIVAVHDIGEEDGRLYFAMEYVEGRTLDRELAANGGPFPPATALALVREAALAVQAAHDAGVVHRDLKPVNVIREPSGRLKVMDFGLAKLADAAPIGATRTGQIMGTPSYMSPEHVDGGMREVDARSDVYQLGAILYELLCGRRPYEAETTTEVLLRIARDDPPPPSRWRPGLDPRAETICRKAMAREKARRYATARELAEDCGRFLDGAAILARPDTVGERALRFARRRPGFAATLAAAALALACAGFLGWRTRSLEREVLEAIRAAARTNVEAVLMVRRAGGKMADVRAKFLIPLEEAVRRAQERAPGLAEPHHHLGRLYRALLRFDDALAEQERALAKDPEYAPARYERAVLLARRHGVRLAGLRDGWMRREKRTRIAGAGFIRSHLGGERDQEPPVEELAGQDPEAGRLRAAIAADVARLERAPDALPPGRLDAARGLALACGTDADRVRARALLERAAAAEPTLEEAHEALARLARAEREYDRAIEILGRALEVDAGYVPYLVARGETLRDLPVGRGADPGENWQRSEADFTRALDLDPESLEARQGRGLLRWSWGIRFDMRGADAATRYVEAKADLEEASRLAPDSVPVWLSRASLDLSLAYHYDRRNGDARASFTASAADCDRIVDLDPELLEGWLYRAQAAGDHATYLHRQGEDPKALFETAERDFAAALRVAPDDPLVLLHRGIMRGNWAIAESDFGRDPQPRWKGALEDFARAAERAPGAVEPLWRRAQLLVFVAAGSPDPESHYAEGVKDARRALERDPEDPGARAARTNLLANWAAYRDSRRLPTEDLYREAIADAGAVIERRPDSPHEWRARGELWSNWGRSLVQRGEDPMPKWAEAEKDFDRALELAADDRPSLRARGELRCDQAGMLRRRKDEAGVARALGLALADYERALALRAGDPKTLAGRGTVQFMAGRYPAAVADLEAAGKADPGLARMYQGMLGEARRRSAEGTGK